MNPIRMGAHLEAFACAVREEPVVGRADGCRRQPRDTFEVLRGVSVSRPVRVLVEHRVSVGTDDASEGVIDKNESCRRTSRRWSRRQSRMNS